MPRANPADIRRELKQAGAERKRARGALDKADRNLARLLAKAQANPAITMTEAAKLAGLGRVNAYKLVREKRSRAQS